MRLAALDLGSNSTRTLVADVTEDGGIVEVARRSTVTRLGHGVDGAGRLHPEALARVEAELAEVGSLLAEHGVLRAVGAMTSAVRDAADGEDLLGRVRRDHGVDARVLTGEVEAELTFRGAVAGRREAAAGPALVCDVGGGSTELAIGDPHGGLELCVSTQVGVVRHTERHLHHDPPTGAELHALAEDAAAALAEAVPDEVRGSVRGGLAVAGTATSSAAMVQRLDPYDPARVHGFGLLRADVEDQLARVAGMTVDQRRHLPGLHPDRAPTIAAGLAILAEVLRLFDLHEVEVSEHDLLHGALLEAAAGRW